MATTMRILQIVTSTATRYDRKHQSLDREALQSLAAVETWTERAGRWKSEGEELAPNALVRRARESDALIVYAADLPRPLLRAAGKPYVASSSPPASRLPWRKVQPPAALDDATLREGLPEAIAPEYFQQKDGRRNRPQLTVGSIDTPHARSMRELTLARIYRFREDIQWELFDAIPSVSELHSVHVWVDPAASPVERDGGTAEALASGLPVAATRTALNEIRLDRGMAGVLVPPRDANELAHAIVGLLFKPERAATRLEHAAQHARRFAPEHRAAALVGAIRRMVRP
jgi:hypothetical protein